jgi:serine/threonine protein kinase/predicted ATPase
MNNHKLIAGRFEILDFLREGGMGMVYLAQDIQTGEKVAIKKIHTELIQRDPEIFLRFAREGEVLRQLDHPNIVKLLALLEENECQYLVLEYVEGGSLADLLEKERQLPVDQVLTIALELADALSRTHHLKIIHRDIKPANVLLAQDGTPRLTDFGVARIDTSEVTKTGYVVGTLSYLPPEAFHGNPPDARSDLWSLGVMLFELLAGYRPFDSEQLSAIMFAILTQPTPDLEAIRPDIPVALIDLIYRLLEKNRDQRVPSARLVGAELEELIHHYRGDPSQPVLHHPVVPRSQTRPSNTPHYLHNFPVQTTPFVGREAELNALKTLISDPMNRLITILGPGGMGKTRLVLEAGAQQLGYGQYAQGVFFVSLAPLVSPEFIVTTIAEAIHFQFYPGGEPKHQLLEYLHDKSMLLILDNFEHLLMGVSLVSDILQAAPNIKMIATSRTKLNLQEEILFRVEGMDFPDWKLPADALEYSAVKLFLQSASRVRPNFDLHPNDLLYLARICRQVQGMPLGILLAAAWIDMLSLAEISQEIEKNIDFLETEQHNVPTRQRSIRAVFEYSWNLLSGDERTVFAKLSVFRGGFTREAAEKIAGGTLRTLAALVNKSMLRRDPDGRYDVHELLRQYGELQLNEQPETKRSVFNAHCHYYAAFMKACDAHVHSNSEAATMQTIERDFDNILMAWEWAIDNGDESAIRQIIFTLDRYLAIRSLHIQKHEILQQAAQKLETLESRSATPSLRFGVVLGFLSICYGDNNPAGAIKGLEVSDRALSILRQYNVPHELAFTLLLRCWLDRDPTRRVQILRECVANFRLTQDEGRLGIALFELAAALIWIEEDPRIAELRAESDTILLARGDPDTLILQIYHEGYIAVTQRDYDRAEESFQYALYLSQENNYQSMIANSRLWFAMCAIFAQNYEKAALGFQELVSMKHDSHLFVYTEITLINGLALLAYQQSRYIDAEQISLDALSMSRTLGDFYFVSASLNQLARAAIALGKIEAAKDYLQESLKLAVANVASLVYDALVAVANLLTKEGQPEKAVTILSFVCSRINGLFEKGLTSVESYADTVFQLPMSRCLAEQQLAALKTLLSPETFDSAENQGKKLTLEDVVVQDLLMSLRLM